MSVRVCTANMDFAKRGDPRYVQWLTAEADVLLLQEAKDFDLARALPAGWTSLQDTTSDDTKGACIAVRDETIEVLDHRLELGVRPVFRGRPIAMLVRHIATAHLRERATGRRFSGISAHDAPGRFSFLQPAFTKNLHDVTRTRPNVIVGTDANEPIEHLADALGLDAYGRGIVGILTDLPVGSERVRAWGPRHNLTDHPAVFATITIPAPKEHR